MNQLKTHRHFLSQQLNAASAAADVYQRSKIENFLSEMIVLLWCSAEHHACPYAECRHGFIAFGNAEELREHNLRSHRGRPAPPGNHALRLNALFDTLTEQARIQ